MRLASLIRILNEVLNTVFDLLRKIIKTSLISITVKEIKNFNKKKFCLLYQVYQVEYIGIIFSFENQG